MNSSHDKGEYLNSVAVQLRILFGFREISSCQNLGRDAHWNYAAYDFCPQEGAVYF